MSAKKKVYETSPSFEELFNRIECDSGLIFIDTPEESRVIREIFKKYRGHSVQFWSLTQGLIEIPKEDDPERFLPHDYASSKSRSDSSGQLPSRGNIMNTFTIIEQDCRAKIANEDTSDIKTIYILRDAECFFQQPGPLRALRDIIYLASCSGSSVIVTGSGISVPNNLEKDSCFVKIPYPTLNEILDKTLPNVRQRIERHNKLHTDPKEKVNEDFDPMNVARACAGLTEDQILNTIGYSTTVKRAIDIDLILEEKKAVINKSDILKYWICDNNMDDVGGFAVIKKWIGKRKYVIDSPNAKAFKAKTPKGIMLLGVQGSGKTYIGKCIAKSLGVGLIKLDMGKVFAGLVGESEKRMRQALAQAEAAGGVVLVDEIDKGLSGAGSSDKTDGGTTSRVIGTLLTWMSEDHPGVFLIATANDISNLNANHPELLRKGRFDEIWFSDAPTQEEREEIFKIHLRLRDRDAKKFEVETLAGIEYSDENSDKTFTYTGAEIEYAIDDALSEKFAEGEGKPLTIGGKDDITTEDIASRLRIIKPITFISKNTISPMRKWAKLNARSVSVEDDGTKKKASGKGKSKLNMRSNIIDNEDVEI